ncbi:MAG: hypothetical protein LBC22_05190 [Endomicrobium sp.]|nr:hypothetical protein [Endomicrobium sp.]
MVKDIKEITNALWAANIWEYEKVEKMYGMYRLISESQRGVIDKMSIRRIEWDSKCAAFSGSKRDSRTERVQINREEIGEGAFRTYKKAVGLLVKEEIGKEGLMQQTEIIRIVSEMLMIGVEKPELMEAINQGKIGEMTVKRDR